MRKNLPTNKLFPSILVLMVFASSFLSCENHRFDRDKRQIIAKDEIRNTLHRPRGFDVTAFREDTVATENDSDFKKQIQYSLDIEYLDSNKVLQKKKGIVMFAPDGQSVISIKITDR